MQKIACPADGFGYYMTLSPIQLSTIVVWYPHVRKSCKDTRDGTFLANGFITPLLMNEASAQKCVLFFFEDRNAMLEDAT
jgi:hypothetical protein